MNVNWWSFWDDQKGFDLGRFEQHYKQSRVAAGKRELSNTRLRLKRLRDRGVRCLETNLFMNEQLGGHGGGESCKDLLPLFIENIRPLNAIIAHGSLATKHLRAIALPAGVRTYFLKHFRSESYEHLDKVADEILSIK
jgi:hypothetical protein